MQDWRSYLSDEDLATIERGQWAQPIGYGVRPALIVIGEVTARDDTTLAVVAEEAAR